MWFGRTMPATIVSPVRLTTTRFVVTARARGRGGVIDGTGVTACSVSCTWDGATLGDASEFAAVELVALVPDVVMPTISKIGISNAAAPAKPDFHFCSVLIDAQSRMPAPPAFSRR